MAAAPAFRRSSRTGFACTFAASLFASCLAFGPASAQVPPPSLRIATFNTFLLSPVFRCANLDAADCLIQSNDLTEKWANDLADALLADSASIDVIALNEVWDEDAKKILAQRLATIYPVQVRDIDAPVVSAQAQAVADLPGGLRAILPASFAGEDSGLMLFAKADFTMLPFASNAYRWGDQPGEILDATGPVAFVRYRYCASDDCLAAKGAALVRLRHGTSGPIYDIAFTHMQADDFNSMKLFRGVRARQFDEIRALIGTTLGPAAPTLGSGETVMLLGDLNVPTLFASPQLAAATSNGKEFTDLFATSTSFFTSPLYETWSRTSDVADVTPTNTIDNVRLDYIIASPAPPPGYSTLSPRQACVQHLTVPVRFANLQSDHNMVLADINRGFNYCSPAIARKVKVGAVGDPPLKIIDDVTPNGDLTRIALPGAMQWFHVVAPDSGTYSIGIDNNVSLRVDIFLPQDMTTPKSPYNVVPGASKPPQAEFFLDQYVLPPEFYVRVSGVSRTATGNYQLQIRRHKCSSQADACLLNPGEEMNASLSGTTLPPFQIAPQNEAWFRYDIAEGPTSGGPTPVSLTADLADVPRVTAVLADHADPAGLPAPSGSSAGTVETFAGSVQKGAHGYVLVRQSGRAANPTNITVKLDSPLRILTVGNLTCQDETNPELGSDDIYSEFRIDGVIRRVPQTGTAEFDCDEPADVKPWGPVPGAATVTFTDKVSARVLEKDSSGTPSPWFDIGNNPSGPMWGNVKWLFLGGDYRLQYRVDRMQNAPRGNVP